MSGLQRTYIIEVREMSSLNKPLKACLDEESLAGKKCESHLVLKWQTGWPSGNYYGD